MNAVPKLNSPGTGVVITGGASGIGRAIAEALGAVGRPVAIWDYQEEAARQAAAEIGARWHVPVVAVGVDVRVPSAITEGAQITRQALPSVGGIVHCAGIVDTGSLEGVTEESWDDGINTHLRPLVLITQAFLGDLQANPGSAVVGIASINATLGNGINPVYTAAKGGMLSLVRSLADRLARDHIRVNSVSPGMVVTPMLQPTIDDHGDHFRRRILMERFGEPIEIGRAVRFLLSDEASYITASELIVDGGFVSSQR